MTPPRKRGRPCLSKDGKATASLHVKLTERRYAHYCKQSRNLSQWVTDALDKASGYQERQTGEIVQP